MRRRIRSSGRRASVLATLSIFYAATGLTVSSVAAYEDAQWHSSWGMGVKEAGVTSGAGNRVLVACNENSSIAQSGISFTLANKVPTGDSLILTFDGRPPEMIFISDGHVTSDCHVCAKNFNYVLGLMKSHKFVHVMFESGNSASFTLAGSSDAIGDCVGEFYR